jgi:hypothetical protein
LTDYPDPEVFRRKAVQLYYAWNATKKDQTDIQADEVVDAAVTQDGPLGTEESAVVTGAVANMVGICLAEISGTTKLPDQAATSTS